MSALVQFKEDMLLPENLVFEKKKPKLSFDLPQILLNPPKEFFPGHTSMMRNELMHLNNKAVESMLRKKTVPVDIRRISSDRAYADYIQWVGRTMRRSLRGWNLVGLQAHQIGIPLDIIVLEVRKPREELGLSLERKTFRLRFIVNPQIKAWSGETGIHAEQCGSLAGWEVFRERDMHITITGYTLEGEYFEMDLHEFIALLFQHEFDHRSEKVENRLLIDFMKKKDIKPIRRKTYNQFNVIATKVGSRMGELLKQLAIAAEDDPELNDETLKRLTDAVTLRGRPGSSITDGTWVEEFDEDPNRM